MLPLCQAQTAGYPREPSAARSLQPWGGLRSAQEGGGACQSRRRAGGNEARRTRRGESHAKPGVGSGGTVQAEKTVCAKPPGWECTGHG